VIFVGEYPISLTVFAVILFLLAIAVEAVTEILTSSEITKPIRSVWRNWTYSVHRPPTDSIAQYAKIWVDKLITCGYCTSVWVSGFFAIWSPKFDFGNTFINWLFVAFVLHRLSNWVHVLYKLVENGRVRTIDLEVKIQDNRDDEHSEDDEDGESGESSP
jgi:hypothetical protein